MKIVLIYVKLPSLLFPRCGLIAFRFEFIATPRPEWQQQGGGRFARRISSILYKEEAITVHTSPAA